MIFLIEFDPKQERLYRFERFDDAQRKEAEEKRLQIELDVYPRDPRREVILLHAADEATIRRTHRRYFETLKEMAKSLGEQNE